MESFKNLLIAWSDDATVATVTINRPQKLNALNLATVRELHVCLSALATHETLAALVFTGAGEKAFIAGADIAELKARDHDEAWPAYNSKLFQEVEEFPHPTIAAVNGYCLGGGCEFAMACDLRVASPSAQFGQPEVKLGIIPAAGATQRLPRHVGLGRAKQLIYTGAIIDAAEAYRIGLVNEIAADGDALGAAHALGATIARHSRLAVRLAKIALNESARTGVTSGLTIETLAQALLYDSDDKHARMQAFLDKRADS